MSSKPDPYVVFMTTNCLITIITSGACGPGFDPSSCHVVGKHRVRWFSQSTPFSLTFFILSMIPFVLSQSCLKVLNQIQLNEKEFNDTLAININDIILKAQTLKKKSSITPMQ